MAKQDVCEKHNCSLPPHPPETWHVKKVKNGKVVISWLNGVWRTPDGQEGTYRYVPVEADSPLVEGEPKFGTRPNLPFPSGLPYVPEPEHG